MNQNNKVDPNNIDKKKKKKKGPKVLEIEKKKTKKEEDKFFIKFSGVQLDAVLLFILSATFLTAGILNYLTQLGELVKIWLSFIVISIMSLTISVCIITFVNVFTSLKVKRILNFFSFVTFLIGALMFFISLVYLLILLF